jgi:hypothetical protein
VSGNLRAPVQTGRFQSRLSSKSAKLDENQPVSDSSTRTAAGDAWPAPGSEDTELGVLMEREVGHGEAKVYTRVQA